MSDTGFVNQISVECLLNNRRMSVDRVPTVMENPGKSWKKVVMESHKKSWKIAKIQDVMEICLPGKKSNGKVMEISCPNPPNRVLIVL